jgi:hypothetical protein
VTDDATTENHRRWTRSDVLSALALITSIVGVVLSSYGGIPGFRAEFFPPADCDRHPDLHNVRPVEATATVTLPAQGTSSYAAANAIDDNTQTAWITTGTDGGEGQSIVFRFDRPQDLRLVCVVNGYARSEDLSERNAKIRDLVVETDRGKAPGTLLNQGGFQMLPLPAGPTTRLKLTISTHYSGAMRDGRPAYQDTALSEVACYARR